ncbi:hypothetical protein ANN_08165 [Periplaneta americana]|uniref:DDE-1 domain-containing protein n=1 Tax=Periplaneta americana TaxID=6978 RepID=A0ABQ8T0M7_PERAM|nr:hypothetical protein ANN_08165 [Periplaneta americana]
MRDYKRKSDRKPVTSEMLAEAQEKIASGMSKRKVAEHFGIDESTLRKRLKKGTGVSALGRFKCILNQEQEMELAQHCNLLSDITQQSPKNCHYKRETSCGKGIICREGPTGDCSLLYERCWELRPPALIFPRKREKEELMNGAPPGSVMFISDSGYINCELFVKWLRHFQNHVGATTNKPVLLILDNHTSHITLENVQYCRENSIHLLSLPPHSSHKMQPLDRCYFKSLKDFYSTYCDQWMMSNPGRVITQFQVAQLFGKAYLKNSTAEKAVKAFEVCGIVPMDRLKFGEEDFLPSEVTDQRSISPSASCDDFGSHNEQQPPQPSTSGVSKASKTDVQECECSPCGSSENREGTQYSPSEIIPVPKVEFKRKRMGKGKKSTVLTSTPHKTALEMERNSKVNVANRKLTFKTGTKEKKEKSKKPESSEKTICPGCDMDYEDPPQKTG